MLSVFMLTKNPISRGFPFVESILQVKKFTDDIVVVDSSEDGTHNVLKKLGCRVLEGDDFNLYKECKNDIVLWIEPNEIIEDKLVKTISTMIKYDEAKNITFYRIEVHQNFQKVAWYPHRVHRVFPKSKDIIPMGVTTNKDTLKRNLRLGLEEGFLWGCFNNFVRNWINDVCDASKASLVPDVYTRNHILDCDKDFADCVEEDAWTMTNTVLRIPSILSKHVGKEVYDPNVNLRNYRS